MKKLRIVFMGTPEFAVPSLHALLASTHMLVAVVSAADKPQGRGLNLLPSPVKSVAKRQGLPILQPEEVSDGEFIQALKSYSADIFIVVGFRILPIEVYTIPDEGTVNLHASLLPKYRGAAPINWAIINGESETGVTTFYIEQKVDTGNIILQKKVIIGPDQTAGELHDELAITGADLLVRTVNLIASGKATRCAQQGEVTRAPKITHDLCEIVWKKGAEEIHNLVRGLSPCPGAFTLLDGKVLKIYRTAVLRAHGEEGRCGEVIKADVRTGDFWVRTGDGGCIALREMQHAGKRRMTAAEFLCGKPLHRGTLLGAARIDECT